jgi:hypothetical protein
MSFLSVVSAVDSAALEELPVPVPCPQLTPVEDEVDVVLGAVGRLVIVPCA